jgi:hypothetical protein
METQHIQAHPSGKEPVKIGILPGDYPIEVDGNMEAPQKFKGLGRIKDDAPILLSHQHSLVHKLQTGIIGGGDGPIMQAQNQPAPSLKGVVTAVVILQADVVIAQVITIADKGDIMPDAVEGET